VHSTSTLRCENYPTAAHIGQVNAGWSNEPLLGAGGVEVHSPKRWPPDAGLLYPVHDEKGADPLHKLAQGVYVEADAVYPLADPTTREHSFRYSGDNARRSICNINNGGEKGVYPTTRFYPLLSVGLYAPLGDAFPDTHLHWQLQLVRNLLDRDWAYSKRLCGGGARGGVYHGGGHHPRRLTHKRPPLQPPIQRQSDIQRRRPSSRERGPLSAADFTTAAKASGGACSATIKSHLCISTTTTSRPSASTRSATGWRSSSAYIN